MEIPLIKGRDFIVFGLQPWDIPIGSNCKNIAAEFAKQNRVLYVNRPLDRISKLKSRGDVQTKNRLDSLQTGKNVLQQEQTNLWVFNPPTVLESINFLPGGFVYDFLNRRNCRKLAKQILWATKELSFHDPILFIDDDFFNGQYLKEYLQPSLFVYYIRDFLLSQQYFLKHGHKAEPSLISKADAVAANSKYLANYAAKYNSNVADVGQGCDVEDFLQDPGEVPADLKNIPYPIIGYCGSLTATRLDIHLLHFIASQKPHWQLVLVGPEDEAFKTSALHGLPNVHFTGGKPPAMLPAYTHAFDVCINPQLLNQMTIGNYPRKVDEYLAAGKPVVATKTEAMEMFGDNVYLCKDKEEYLDMIVKAVSEPENSAKKESRVQMGKSHTWEASVNAIYSLIEKTLSHGRK